MSSPNIELTIALAAIAALTIHAILMVLAFYIFYRIFQDSLLLSASLRRLLDVAADHLQAIDKHIADGNPTAKPQGTQAPSPANPPKQNPTGGAVRCDFSR